MDLGIMMVAADVVDRFHEAIEFIAVDGKRLAEPHPDPANGDSEAMEWMADHFLALVKDYARRYPVGCSTKFLPAETASSREDWDDDDEQSRLHDFASRISLRPDTSLDLDSTYAEPDVFHLSLVGPVERDAYHPSREFPGTIDLEFPGRLTTVHQLARALVVADVCNAFHASMEFTSVTATGERVADPHPGGANSKQEFLMWSWLVGHVDAIVGAYQEQFPA